MWVNVPEALWGQVLLIRLFQLYNIWAQSLAAVKLALSTAKGTKVIL